MLGQPCQIARLNELTVKIGDELLKMRLSPHRHGPNQKKPIHPIRIGVGIKGRQPGSPGVAD
jgi:hypothetical protein